MITDNKKGRDPISVDEIRQQLKAGKTISDVAKEQGVSRQAIYQRLKKDNIRKGALTPADEVMNKIANNPRGRSIIEAIGSEKASAFVQYHLDLFKMGMGADYKDVPGLYKRFSNYLAYCTEHGIVPNNMSAYLAIGVQKEMIDDWRSGRKGTAEHQRFAREVSAFFASVHEQGGTNGLMNPIQTIFWQKAYDGLSDQPKVEIEVTNPLGEKRSAEDIAQAYGEVELPD